jgi:hypothetical protein
VLGFLVGIPALSDEDDDEDQDEERERFGIRWSDGGRTSDALSRMVSGSVAQKKPAHGTEIR